MRLIQAYVREHMAQQALDALRSEHVHGVSVFHGQGFGREYANGEYLDTETSLGFSKVVRIDVLCLGADERRVVSVIRKAAHTGKHGDGKIAVSTIDRVVDIRSDTEDEAVL